MVRTAFPGVSMASVYRWKKGCMGRVGEKVPVFFLKVLI